MSPSSGTITSIRAWGIERSQVGFSENRLPVPYQSWFFIICWNENSRNSPAGRTQSVKSPFLMVKNPSYLLHIWGWPTFWWAKCQFLGSRSYPRVFTKFQRNAIALLFPKTSAVSGCRLKLFHRKLLCVWTWAICLTGKPDDWPVHLGYHIVGQT